VINLVAASVIAGGGVRRAFGVLLAALSMAPAVLTPRDHAVIRAVWVVIAFAGFARSVDLARGTWSLQARLVHVISVVDERRLVRARPVFDGAALLQATLWELLALVLYQGVGLASRFHGPLYWLVRWFFALAVVYTLSAGAYRLLFLAYRAIGFITPPLHIAPAASRSVQEFWGERWNRTIGLWLAETFFRPLARRRHPVMGVLAAFAASALVHAYIAWVAVSWEMAIATLVFFLSQAVVIAVERLLRVREWSKVAGHAWAIAWMAGLSPLFTEPMLQAFGV
jgi:hypothetical protein